jgi:hypothetical protein
LGILGTPSIYALGNEFGSTLHFNDCYNFTLESVSDAAGIVLDLDASLRRDIDLGSISVSGGRLSSSLMDPTPSAFSFDNLLAGVYQLVISGDVTGRDGGLFGGGIVGYGGLLVVTSPPVAAPVPEPSTWALLTLGLMTVGWAACRAAARRTSTWLGQAVETIGPSMVRQCRRASTPILVQRIGRMEHGGLLRLLARADVQHLNRH